MTDIVENPEVEQVEVDQETVDTTVENDQSNGEVTEQAEEKPAKFEPWKIKQEKKEESHIPYSRFKEVNEEKKAYGERLAQLESELSKYTEREKQLAEIKTPDDIKISDYTDPEEYLKARDTAIKNQAIKEVEERFIAREQQRIVEAKNQEITNNYVSNLEASFKRNPEIKEAVTWFDNYAHNLHPDVAYEMLIDENVGELIYDISSDKALLTKLFKGDPKDVIRMIHKMSAKIDHPTRYAHKNDQENGRSDENVEVPKPLPKKLGIPTVIKGGKAPTKSLDDMTMDEYRKYVAKRDKKS